MEDFEEYQINKLNNSLPSTNIDEEWNINAFIRSILFNALKDSSKTISKKPIQNFLIEHKNYILSKYMYIIEYRYFNIYLAIHEKIKDMIILTKSNSTIFGKTIINNKIFLALDKFTGKEIL